MSALLGLVPMPYRLLALALLLAAVWGHGWVKGNGHGEQKLAAFVAETRLAGVKAQAAANATIARDKQRKDESDAQYKTSIASLRAAADRMRNNHPARGQLPAPAPSPTCPTGQRCFDRGEFDTALSRYWDSEEASTTAIDGLIGEGATVKLRLDSAIRWAKP